MTATQKHDIIPVCTTVLSADQQPKEDIMLDQQKITILYCRLSNEDVYKRQAHSQYQLNHISVPLHIPHFVRNFASFFKAACSISFS